jgi:outer membrane protein OmpA-like peptidoglycan-associated protein
MTRILLLFAFIAVATNSFCQGISGLGFTSYGGIMNVGVNPAIAGGRYAYDINIASVAGQQRSQILSLTPFNSSVKGLQNFHDYSLRFSDKLLNGATNGNFFESEDVLLPGSLLVNISKKGKNIQTAAFTYNFHNHFSLQNFSPDLMRSAVFFPQQALYNATMKDLTLNEARWVDYGLTYSRVLYNEEKHFVSAGLTVKLLQSISGRHLYSPNVDIMKSSALATQMQWNQATYFRTDDISQGDEQLPGITGDNSFSAGGDIGVVYEFRPFFREAYYRMDDSNYVDHNKLTHLAAVGVSLTDFGKLSFNNAGIGNITSFSSQFSDSTLFFADRNFEDSLALTAKHSSVESFKMQLPTMLNVFADINAYKGLGVNVFYRHSIIAAKADVPAIIRPNILQVTLKYENDLIGVYTPVTLINDQDPTYGLSLRIGPVSFGTNDLMYFANGSKDPIKTAEWHVGLRIPIGNKRKADNDHDEISNAFDKCPDLYGVKSAKGCPDIDCDGVEDKDDFCLTIPGIASMKGCPDKDGDGITDADDGCPEHAGPLNGSPKAGCPDEDMDGFIDSNGDDKCPGTKGDKDGCPDQDNDGLYDNLDKCPTKHGNGFASDGGFISGCPDTDDDGLADEYEDACPDLQGPKDNMGCPLLDYDSDMVYDYEDECQTIKGTRENNGCPPKKLLNIRLIQEIVYFEGDAVLSDGEKQRLTKVAPIILELLADSQEDAIILQGHADINESADRRKLISTERANAVKSFLETLGVPSSRMIVEAKGDDMPHKKKSFPTGAFPDRRVEIFVDVAQKRE